MSLQFVLRLCLIVLDVNSVDLPSGLVTIIFESVLNALPDFMSTLIAALFLKNTLSTRALHRALWFSVPFSLTYFLCSIITNWNHQISCCLLLMLDTLLLLCCVFLVFRQCSYSPKWKRRNIIIRLSYPLYFDASYISTVCTC